MAYIDYSYYTNTFHGTTIAQTTFERLAEIASDVIDGLATAKAVSSLDTTSEAYAKVKRACAYLVEALNANGGVDAITGFSASGAGSESLGDYSVSSTGAQSQGTVMHYGDIRVPQLAYMLLMQAGLISRWAYAGTVVDDGF